MAKMIRHDFGSIHDALNKMIIAEVKAALELLPEREIGATNGLPLCRIVVSDNVDYKPENLGVTRIWLDDEGKLHFQAFVYVQDCMEDVSDWDEDCADWLDITDFEYLIDQIAEQVEGGKTYNLPKRSVTVCGYVVELALKQEVEKTVTV